MKYDPVPFIKPLFPDTNKLAAEYERIKLNNWYTNCGPNENNFREEIEKYIGQSTHAATFNNATSALLAAIIGCLGRGDSTKYIVVPSFTFVAGPQAIVWCGYKPLFFDINPSTLQMDINGFDSMPNDIKNKIAGILFCNTFGVGDPGIDRWVEVSKDYKIPLMVDSAAGFGSRYEDGTYLGARGDCEIFSFHATKPFAIGEGGAVVSKNKKLIDKLYAIQNFGFNNNRDSTELGFNGKLQEINAAIGLLQLKDFRNRLSVRQNTVREYKKSLEPKGYKFQDNIENSSACFVNIICKSSVDKNNVLINLTNGGIQARDYYNPVVHKQDYFRHTPTPIKLKQTDDVASKIISLPVHDNMSIEIIERITSFC